MGQDRWVGHEGLSFPGALRDKSDTEGRGNVSFARDGHLMVMVLSWSQSWSSHGHELLATIITWSSHSRGHVMIMVILKLARKETF